MSTSAAQPPVDQRCILCYGLATLATEATHGRRDIRSETAVPRDASVTVTRR
jgi:hypothetical protein